ncbi:MAG: hypothetical protein V4628_04880 [Pseudomonadota bacterium]
MDIEQHANALSSQLLLIYFLKTMARESKRPKAFLIGLEDEILEALPALIKGKNVPPGTVKLTRGKVLSVLDVASMSPDLYPSNIR